MPCPEHEGVICNACYRMMNNSPERCTVHHGEKSRKQLAKERSHIPQKERQQQEEFNRIRRS